MLTRLVFSYLKLYHEKINMKRIGERTFINVSETDLKRLESFAIKHGYNILIKDIKGKTVFKLVKD